MVNPDELDQTTAPAPSRRETGPTAVAACYDRRIHRVVVRLNTGLEVAFQPYDAPGLETATLDDLSVIEIRPSGLDLHVPALAVDLHLPALLERVLGSSVAEAERCVRYARQEAAQQLEIAYARVARAEQRATNATHAFQRVKWKLSKYRQSEASTMGDAVGDAVSDG